MDVHAWECSQPAMKREMCVCGRGWVGGGGGLGGAHQLTPSPPRECVCAVAGAHPWIQCLRALRRIALVWLLRCRHLPLRRPVQILTFVLQERDKQVPRPTPPRPAPPAAPALLASTQRFAVSVLRQLGPPCPCAPACVLALGVVRQHLLCPHLAALRRERGPVLLRAGVRPRAFAARASQGCVAVSCQLPYPPSPLQAKLMDVSFDPMAASALESARGRAPASALPAARHFPLDGYIPCALAKVPRPS
jgi:hypothetical protein